MKKNEFIARYGAAAQNDMLNSLRKYTATLPFTLNKTLQNVLSDWSAKINSWDNDVFEAKAKTILQEIYEDFSKRWLCVEAKVIEKSNTVIKSYDEDICLSTGHTPKASIEGQCAPQYHSMVAQLDGGTAVRTIIPLTTLGLALTSLSAQAANKTATAAQNGAAAGLAVPSLTVIVSCAVAAIALGFIVHSMKKNAQRKNREEFTRQLQNLINSLRDHYIGVSLEQPDSLLQKYCQSICQTAASEMEKSFQKHLLELE